MIRFKGNGRRIVTKNYTNGYKELRKVVKDAKDHGWQGLWGMGSGRADLNCIQGIDTDKNYYDYSAVDAYNIGPCFVYAAKTDENFDEFLRIIEEKFGNYRIHNAIETFQFLPKDVWSNEKDRRVELFSKYITIDKFYDGVEIIGKNNPLV